MVRLLSFVLLPLILSLGVPDTAAGQDKSSDKEVAKLQQVFQAKLDEIARESSFPGCSCALVLPDGQVITAVSGDANREKNTKMMPEHKLMSASIGKTYFAAMAMQQLAEKKISLDDDVAKYLSKHDWFKRIPNHDSITIAHLMRHQTGIPRYILNRQVWKDMMADPDLKWKPGDQLKYIYDRKPLHEAGKGWAYSDTNYILLGLILEQVSGKDVYTFVREQFLKPNQLNHTIPNDRRELKGLVQGYSSMFKALGVPDKMLDDGVFVFNPQMEWCGGGFCCTASDLAKWAHIYFSGAALEGDYLKTLVENAADSGRMLGQGSRYGLGVIIRETDMGQMLGHDGGFPGYSSTMGYYAKHKMAASFMYNTDARGAIPRRAESLMSEMVEAVVQAKASEGR